MDCYGRSKIAPRGIEDKLKIGENLMHRDLGHVVETLSAKKSRREAGLKGSSVRVS